MTATLFNVSDDTIFGLASVACSIQHTRHTGFMGMGINLFKMLVGSNWGARPEGPQLEARRGGILGGQPAPSPLARRSRGTISSPSGVQGKAPVEI